ncbi:hypothetical protein FFF34_006200 [Inquilinus sp. KBS0705]|nr:hypothetical protein FFF34_006200 [Inquilinus sp. KBS0705]
MKSFLADRLDPNIKLYPLGIFDYLLNDIYKQNLIEPLQTQSIPQKWDVIYCGNLNRVKSSFIYLANKLDKKNWLLNLYGLGLEEDIQTITTKYHGSFDPNMPIIEAGSHFGLIWDGDSIETCSGVYGKYLKMNNPHKLSLYIAINMPIIIWEQAALADFVINNGIGFTISSLHDIDDKLLNITYKEYQAFKNNLKQFNKNVTTGQYLTLSLKQVRQHL